MESVEQAGNRIIRKHTLYGSPEAEIGTNARSTFETELTAFNLGAKWMAEQMYSAEEVKEILIRFKSDVITNHHAQVTNVNPYQWFKQFIKDEENQGRMIGYTEDQMFMFAGYCMGKKLVDPFKDASVIMQEWKEEFKNSQDA